MTPTLSVTSRSDSLSLFTIPPRSIRRMAEPPDRREYLTTWHPHLLKIGLRHTDVLRRIGIWDWRQLDGGPGLLPRKLRSLVRNEVGQSLAAFWREAASHSLTRVPQSEHRRDGTAFPDKTAFIDEAQGNEDESLSVVPRIERISPYPELVIGVSGYTGSGKSTVTQMMASCGFGVVSFSHVLADLFPAVGHPRSRQELQRIGEEVHENPGQRWLDQKVLAVAAQWRFVSIDGLRFPEDHAFFMERLRERFIHIHVNADARIRKARFLDRGGTENEYKSAQRSSTEMYASQLADLAHRTVENNGRLEEIRAVVESWPELARLRSAQQCR